MGCKHHSMQAEKRVGVNLYTRSEHWVEVS